VPVRAFADARVHLSWIALWFLPRRDSVDFRHVAPRHPRAGESRRVRPACSRRRQTRAAVTNRLARRPCPDPPLALTLCEHLGHSYFPLVPVSNLLSLSSRQQDPSHKRHAVRLAHSVAGHLNPSYRSVVQPNLVFFALAGHARRLGCRCGRPRVKRRGRRLPNSRPWFHGDTVQS